MRKKVFYKLPDDLKQRLSEVLSKAPSKEMFHCAVAKEIYPTIKGSTILHNNNKLEVYHYD